MRQNEGDRTVGMFKMLSVSELGEFPPPSWLIEGLVEEGVFGVVYGASGEGKSFLALDWAMSIAAGLKTWQERRVKQGPVICVVAEGGRNVAKRLRAWMRQHDCEDVEHMLVVLDAVQFRDTSHVTGLLAQIQSRNLKPRLVVIDTLARCFLGGDENSSQDMGQFVEACNRVQRETDAAVLAIHHTAKPSGKKPKAERGSYALRGAADVMIRVSKNDGLVRVEVDKQKDDDVGKPIYLHLKRVVIGKDAESGEEVTSCVLTAAAPDLTDERELPTAILLNASELLALTVLVERGEMKSGEWRDEISGFKGEVVKPKSFQNWRSKLVEEGFVEKINGRYRAMKTGHATVNANGTPSVLSFSPNRASHATPPKGVAGGAGEAQVRHVSGVVGEVDLSVPFTIASMRNEETQ